jgi:hypothetical protein
MRKIFFPILVILMVVMGTACSQVADYLLPPNDRGSELLTIERVAESDGAGQFILSGKANLPKQTQLTVSAVRSLTLTTVDDLSNQRILYGILDRQTAVVEDGRWQAKVSLWIPSPEGYYQENWQQEDALIIDDLRPNPMVDFFVTVEPKEFTRSVATASQKELGLDTTLLLNFTPDGEPYLKTSTALAIPLPKNIKSFTIEPTSQLNSPWQGRASLDNANSAIERLPESPFLEEDNLPLPSENLIR